MRRYLCYWCTYLYSVNMCHYYLINDLLGCINTCSLWYPDLIVLFNTYLWSFSIAHCVWSCWSHFLNLAEVEEFNVVHLKVALKANARMSQKTFKFDGGSWFRLKHAHARNMNKMHDKPKIFCQCENGCKMDSSTINFLEMKLLYN